MKRATLSYIAFLILGISSVLGQSGSFRLSDRVIRQGQVFRTTGIHFSFAQCKLVDRAPVFLDSLLIFLKERPKVEIMIFRREFSSAEMSAHYHNCRCDQMKQYLISRGIEEFRLKTEGITEVIQDGAEVDIQKNTYTEIIITKDG